MSGLVRTVAVRSLDGAQPLSGELTTLHRVDELQAALLLALWTGQRQGDLLRLTWKDYDGAYIRMRQSKGRGRKGRRSRRSRRRR